MMKSFAIALVSTICATGCTSTPYMKSYLETRASAASPELQNAALDSEFQSLLTGPCQTAADKLTKAENGQNSMQTYIGLLGIFAGSIAVPGLVARTVVSKSTVAAWGGVSGASTATILMLNNNGMSPAQTVSIYTQFRTDVQSAMDDYSASNAKVDARQKAYDKLFVTCTMLPMQSVTPPPAAQAANAKG